MPPSADPGLAERYREGGAGDVPGENERQWARWAIVPRPLRPRTPAGSAGSDVSIIQFGRPYALPVVVAPTAFHGLWDDGAEAGTASAAETAGALFVLSQASTLTPEEVGGPPRLQQIYLPADRELARPFLDRIRGAGTLALVLTIDQLPVPRLQSFRADLSEATHRDGSALLGRPAYDPDLPGSGPAPVVTAEDIGWLREAGGLPVLVKGVLHPADARLAVEHGAAGIVVSNHGGRQVPGSITTAEALPRIVDAVAGRVPVHVDSGIRSADDVFRALCLGATTAWIGRPVLRHLERGGPAAVTDFLHGLRDELAGILALCGAASLADCSPDLVWVRR